MRSSGPVRALHYGGADYVANANDEIVIMAMIETKEGLANLDAICATPASTRVHWAVRLSFRWAWSARRQSGPAHIATCDKIRVSAHKHGIKAVMHCASAVLRPEQ